MLQQSIREAIQTHLALLDQAEIDIFLERFDRYAPDIINLLKSLYAGRDDLASHLTAIFITTAEAYQARPNDLRLLDRRREENPTWYQHHSMMGAFCYVDRFAKDVAGLRTKLPYLKELGIRYLHLMPLFRTPPGPNDGGFAVSTYREVQPALGTMNNLRALAIDLRAEGISLVLDFVFNHTADDHTWAEKAKQGEQHYRDFYLMFEDRTLPDEYEKNLREIFPDEHPGQFTWVQEVNAWVWTTFHTYQWDLNYRNPAVFRQMLGELLFLANVGAEVIRLDAVPFIWKEMGTSCENLPQSHVIIRAFNRLVRLAAPAVIFKSEAIVHPDDVVKYFGTGDYAGKEAQVAYNPLLMVELWEAMATSYTHLLTYSMKHRFHANPPNTAWINYVRSHDDIGWGFADEDAGALGIHGFHHRQYLNRFYTGEEDGSYAIGLPFQYNEHTQDMRISGTAASLNGLEMAIAQQDARAIEYAIRRILLMYSVVLSMGGIPLLNLGDEIGMLNDYGYRKNERLREDSRWAHRPHFDWQRAEKRHNPLSVPGRIFMPLKKLIAIRKATPAFAANSTTAILDGGMRVYVYHKKKGGQGILCAANFTAESQSIAGDVLAPKLPADSAHDLISGRVYKPGTTLTLAPYEYVWLSVG